MPFYLFEQTKVLEEDKKEKAPDRNQGLSFILFNLISLSGPFEAYLNTHC